MIVTFVTMPVSIELQKALLSSIVNALESGFCIVSFGSRSSSCIYIFTISKPDHIIYYIILYFVEFLPSCHGPCCIHVDLNVVCIMDVRLTSALVIIFLGKCILK